MWYTHVFGDWFVCMCMCKLTGHPVILTPACKFSHSQQILLAFSSSNCSSPVRWWVSGASLAGGGAGVRCDSHEALRERTVPGPLTCRCGNGMWSGGTQQSQVRWLSERLRRRKCRRVGWRVEVQKPGQHSKDWWNSKWKAAPDGTGDRGVMASQAAMWGWARIT